MIDVNIKRVYNIFNELANVSGTNAKKDILKKYERDEYFKQVVNFLINPRAVTGISKSKIKKGVQVNNSIEFQSILNLFNYILEHNTGSDEVLGTVLYNVSSLCDEDCVKDFVRNLITKSIIVFICESFNRRFLENATRKSHQYLGKRQLGMK